MLESRSWILPPVITNYGSGSGPYYMYFIKLLKKFYRKKVASIHVRKYSSQREVPSSNISATKKTKGRKNVRLGSGAEAGATARAVIRIRREIFMGAKSTVTNELDNKKSLSTIFTTEGMKGCLKEHILFYLKSISCDCLFNGGNEWVPEGKGGGEEGETHQETHRVPRHSLVVPAHSDSCSYRILPLVPTVILYSIPYRYYPLYRLPKSETLQISVSDPDSIGSADQDTNSDPDPGRQKLSPQKENVYDGF